MNPDTLARSRRPYGAAMPKTRRALPTPHEGVEHGPIGPPPDLRKQDRAVALPVQLADGPEGAGRLSLTRNDQASHRPEDPGPTGPSHRACGDRCHLCIRYQVGAARRFSNGYAGHEGLRPRRASRGAPLKPLTRSPPRATGEGRALPPAFRMNGTFMSDINRSIADLHPLMRQPVLNVLADLKSAGLPFELFEGYRSPARQDALFNQRPRVTSARGWESAHQYGLAVDLVPRVAGVWSWDDAHPWLEMGMTAQRHGLRHPLPIWDKPHVEHAAWPTIRLRL